MQPPLAKNVQAVTGSPAWAAVERGRAALLRRRLPPAGDAGGDSGRGGSSGGVIAALERLRPDLPAEAVCVALLPDRGERYLDTVYSNSWIREHFGDVFHLWA